MIFYSLPVRMYNKALGEKHGLIPGWDERQPKNKGVGKNSARAKKAKEAEDTSTENKNGRPEVIFITHKYFQIFPSTKSTTSS